MNVREDKGVIRPFLEKNRYTFSVPLDADGAVTKKYRVQGIPTTVVIDRQGVLRSVSVGFSPQSTESLHRAVEAALGPR